MGHEGFCTFWLGMQRMQDPDCILLRPLLSFVFAVNNLEGLGDVFLHTKNKFTFTYYESSKFPKLSVPLQKCSTCLWRHPFRPTCIIPVGFGRAWGMKANQQEVLATALSWVIKSFVSDLGILCLLLAYVKQYQISLLACKQGKNLRAFVLFDSNSIYLSIRSSSNRMEQCVSKRSYWTWVILLNLCPESYQWIR